MALRRSLTSSFKTPPKGGFFFSPNTTGSGLKSFHTPDIVLVVGLYGHTEKEKTRVRGESLTRAWQETDTW